jgi:hypothetical protein
LSGVPGCAMSERLDCALTNALAMNRHRIRIGRALRSGKSTPSVLPGAERRHGLDRGESSLSPSDVGDVCLFGVDRAVSSSIVIGD